MRNKASKAVATKQVEKVRAGESSHASDEVAVEEPLEIRVHGEPVATTMRTPGNDRELSLGFLFAEGILGAASDVGTVTPCAENVIDVTAAAGVSLDVERVQASRRGTLTTSACGVCGRRNVEELLTLAGRIQDGRVVSRALVASAPRLLSHVQRGFEKTGGLHAAAAFSDSGELLFGFEDVGRHNAVDKVVGALLLANRLSARLLRGARGLLKADAALLCVSGRASFEIVQKAAMAGTGVVAAISAPSSLSIELAEEANITLVGFVRDGGFNVYTHPERLSEPDRPAQRATHRRPPGSGNRES